MAQVSMRTQIGGLVLVMGLIALGLALMTGEYYRRMIYENVRISSARMASAKAGEIVRQLGAVQNDIAKEIIMSRGFRRAYAARNIALLKALMDKVRLPYAAAGSPVRIDSLYVLDPQFRTIAGVDADPAAQSRCASILASAAIRPVSERSTPFAALCTQSGRAHSVVMVAIDESRPLGYVVVVTDPAPALQAVETSLGVPMRLRVGEGIVHASSRWNSGEGVFVTARTDLAAQGVAPLTMELALDADLMRPLADARRTVMGAAGAATLLSMILALVLLHRSILRPLRNLTERVRQVRSDRSLLGTQITPAGAEEVREMAEEFNELSADLNELQRTLESLAYNDTLTGLPNRVLFRDRLEQQIRIAERERGKFALLAIDLDRFKQINDSLGHHAGDLLLQQVAQRMKRVLRKSDTVAFAGNTVARLGGDEFCVLLPAVADAQGAEAVADKLMHTLDDDFELEGHTLKVGMSIGFAIYPEHGQDVESLSRAADRAMYAAKRRGGGYLGFGASGAGVKARA